MAEDKAPQVRVAKWPKPVTHYKTNSYNQTTREWEILCSCRQKECPK